MYEFNHKTCLHWYINRNDHGGSLLIINTKWPLSDTRDSLGVQVYWDAVRRPPRGSFMDDEICNRQE